MNGENMNTNKLSKGNVPEKHSDKICPKCGKINEAYRMFCTQCGETFPEESIVKTQSTAPIVKKKMDPKKKKILIIVTMCVVCILLAVSFVVYKKYSADKEYEDYMICLRGVGASISLDAPTIEDQYNIIQSVWYDAIFNNDEEDTRKYVAGASDFNEALQNLFYDDEFSETNSELEDGKALVDSWMEELKDVPEGCEEYHNCIINLYTKYDALYDMVTDPSMSYNDYTTKFGDLEEEFIEAYNIYKNKIPADESE